MSTPSTTLSQDLTSSLGGVNLKWALAGLATIKELSLIFFKNSSDADIVSMIIYLWMMMMAMRMMIEIVL
jgi:hypothetical protein